MSSRFGYGSSKSACDLLATPADDGTRRVCITYVLSAAPAAWLPEARAARALAGLVVSVLLCPATCVLTPSYRTSYPASCAALVGRVMSTARALTGRILTPLAAVAVLLSAPRLSLCNRRRVSNTHQKIQYIRVIAAGPCRERETRTERETTLLTRLLLYTLFPKRQDSKWSSQWRWESRRIITGLTCFKRLTFETKPSTLTIPVFTIPRPYAYSRGHPGLVKKFVACVFVFVSLV